ncbi:hypothetical protein DRH27_01520 [Candidatus Falkowbacteria bacterium]|nr:MAG: hypothetical protein DRH27_01520 [Candidatus Falkowbacteria bacterium]
MPENKKTILVIEDDEQILTAMTAGLSHRNFNVVGAKTGEEGLKIIEGLRPNLLLLDLMLPGMSGEDVLTIMHQKKLTEEIPVIILSNKMDGINIKKCIHELGAKDYLLKVNFSFETFVKQVDKLLNKQL